MSKVKMNSRYFLGDCFEVMAKMKDKAVDVTFTSPPYNRKRNDKYTHYDDKINDYYSFLEKAVIEMMRVTKGTVFLNIQKNYYNKTDVFRLIGRFAPQISEVFIWEKSNPMPAAGMSITNSYEFIIAFGGPVKSNRTYTKNHLTTSVYPNRIKSHKAVMHPDIADFFIKNFTKKGDTVLDPFMGCGTTAVSCKNNYRNFVGIELNKEYLDIALKVTKKRTYE